jgi:hypothetical protein
MTEFTSSLQQIPFSAEQVFNKLSNMSNLKGLDQMLGDKVQDFICDTDTCSFKVDPIGSVEIQINEREPNKTIKIKSVQSPVDFLGWIQLAEAAPNDTRLKLTLRVDLPFFLKAMVSSKLEEGIEKAAQALAGIDY